MPAMRDGMRLAERQALRTSAAQLELGRVWPRYFSVQACRPTCLNAAQLLSDPLKVHPGGTLRPHLIDREADRLPPPHTAV